MKAVRKPRVLDAELNEVRRLDVLSQSVEMTMDPPGTADITLADGETVDVRAFVELYTSKGSCGIYRVSAPEMSYTSETRVRLEHGICALDDAVIPGEGEISGSAKAVLEEILSYQTTKWRGVNLWKLGMVEAPEEMEITVEHDGTKTLEMLVRAVERMDGYMIRTDQSVKPWVINVIKKPDEIKSEGRLSRNIRTIRKVVDDEELCTRVYCNALENGYMDSDTTSVWGIVEKSVTINDDVTKEDAEAFCARYLENRKNPTVSVEMEADEWYTMTGEPLDRFEVGDVCRVALPEYQTEIVERIVSIRYMDAANMPEQVTVSLSNPITDMSIRVARKEHETSSSLSSLWRQSTTTKKEITNLKKTAEGFKEIDDKIVKWFSSVEVDLDATEEGAQFGALASYQETFDLFSDVDVRVSEAELILFGGEGTAAAGLVSRVADNEASIAGNSLEIVALSESFLTLNNTTTEALASLGARMERVEGDTAEQSEAVLRLRSDLDSASASLGARISKAEADVTEVSSAFAAFEVSYEEAQAQISARVSDNEASITATATSLGSRIDLKADKTYVDDLVADEIEAAIADISLSIGETVVTEYLTVTGRATLSALALDGSNVAKTTLPIVTSFTQALGESAPTQEYTLLTVA